MYIWGKRKKTEVPSGENSISTRFTSERQPESNGHPKGVKNRTTIARKVLEMISIMPDATFEKLKEVLPEINQQLCAEEVASLILINNIVTKGDVNAYKAIMDSAYGLPKQDIDIEGKITFEINIR